MNNLTLIKLYIEIPKSIIVTLYKSKCSESWFFIDALIGNTDTDRVVIFDDKHGRHVVLKKSQDCYLDAHGVSKSFNELIQRYDPATVVGHTEFTVSKYRENPNTLAMIEGSTYASNLRKSCDYLEQDYADYIYDAQQLLAKRFVLIYPEAASCINHAETCL
jgi:hypothetical protein